MLPKLWIDDYARFLTFNYTNFLESIYGIERERINYIHGRYTDKKGSLIIGHGTPSEETFNNWIDSIRPKYNRLYTNKKGKKYKRRDMLYNAYLNKDYYDPMIEMAVERIEDYFTDSFKDTDQIVLAHKQFFNQLHDIEYIYVLGHSISQVDARYFGGKVVKGLKQFVSYYPTVPQIGRAHV